MKRIKIFSLLCILFCSLQTQAANPPIPEPAKKLSRSDAEYVKEDIGKMKEDVINKKTQMLLFKQLLKTEAFESTFPVVKISHINEMSSRYKIYSLTYSIDGDKVYGYHKEDGTKEVSKDSVVFKGPLAPGTHELLVEVIYKGNDTGIFSYINDYKIPTQGKKTFKVEKGQNLDVQVVGYEKGWALTDFKDRPELKIKFYSPNSSKELK